MNIQDLLDQLTATSDALAELAPKDPQRFDVKLLALQLEKEVIAGSFDVDKDISAITVVDLSKLKDLTSQLSQVTDQEQKRTQLVTQILNISKLALRSTGIPVP